MFNDLKNNLFEYIRLREIEDIPNYSTIEHFFDNIDMSNSAFIVLNYTSNIEKFICHKYPNAHL